MSETFLMTLEVDDNGTIKVQNFKKHVEDAGKATEKAGKQSEASRLGIIAFGDAVQNSAQAIGIHGQASRQLGNSVERMAFSVFPAWGAALGVGVLAGTAAVSVITHLIDRNNKLAEEAKKAAEAKLKLRDEILKAADAAMTWIGQADKSLQKTKELISAEEELRKAEYRRNQDQLERGIFEQEQKVLDMRNKLTLFSAAEATFRGQSLLQSRLITEQDRRQLDLEEKKTKVMRERLAASEKGPSPSSSPAYSEFEFAQIREFTLQENARKKALNDEVSYQQSRVDLYRAYGARMEEVQQVEIAAFAAVAALKYDTLKTEDERSAFFVSNEMARQSLLLKHQKASDQMKLQSAQATAGNISQTAALMYQEGGAHARKWFSIYKTAAISEAIINTYQGASKAIAQGGVYGWALAASVVALGLAQVAKIRAQTFDGGAGGGGAVGTYAANSATGLAEGRAINTSTSRIPGTRSPAAPAGVRERGRTEKQRFIIISAATYTATMNLKRKRPRPLLKNTTIMDPFTTQ